MAGDNKRFNWNKAMELTMIGLMEWMREQIDKHKVPKHTNGFMVRGGRETCKKENC